MLVIGSHNVFWGLVGGLGLFLYGMRTMSDALQKVAGDRMRKILTALTNNRLIGAFVGLAVTAIIQSSSATTVMVVGFVNAGLLSLVQAIGVVLGANVGTTITAQLISLNITGFALPAVAIGGAIAIFSRDRQKSYWGEILFGFGLLFLGLSIMKQGVDPLKHSKEVIQIFEFVGQYHLIGVIIGALMTIIVQSSTATIGITLAMASAGLINFEASVALILGENIGTTFTANFAAIGTNLAARRTACCHFLFNTIGVAFVLLLFPYFMKIVAYISPGNADMLVTTQSQANLLGAMIGDRPFIARHIANAHTLFNVINALIFLPFLGPMARLSTFLIRGQDSIVKMQALYIDIRVLNTPPIALGQAKREIQRMVNLTLSMLKETNKFIETGNLKNVKRLEEYEELVDFLQKEITDFLVALSQKSVSGRTSEELATLMHLVNDIERIGDHCVNLWKLGQRKVEARIAFSEIGLSELADISGKTEDFLTYVVVGLESNNPALCSESIRFEDEIDDLEKTLRNNHIDRLNTGECAVKPGMIFIDMLHNYEKIGDHTYNIAEAILENQG
ncbi:Na/Pi cotransporter family protein [Geopsychrobacter electrodiphilus]|uniref:Na/Pi cotransporter family protein n=1 Tax=Geopsychrobacter electrodiphilus TaxID=225196 RepID=UPI00037E97ED|nr:Na/Pi cotransporter family protein [Geopsychrobacter electrodiphilus]